MCVCARARMHTAHFDYVCLLSDDTCNCCTSNSLTPGAAARNQAFYGPGIGPIFLDDVRCGGFENSLFRCPFDANTRDCSHSEDAGVKCQPRRESCSSKTNYICT